MNLLLLLPQPPTPCSPFQRSASLISSPSQQHAAAGAAGLCSCPSLPGEEPSHHPRSTPAEVGRSGVELRIDLPVDSCAADGPALVHTNSHKAKKAFKIEDAPPPSQGDVDGHVQRVATRSSSISSSDCSSRRSFEYNRENLDMLHEPGLRWSFDFRRDKQDKDRKFELGEEMQLEAMDMKELCL